MKKQTKFLMIAVVLIILVSPLAVFEIISSQTPQPPTSSNNALIRVACVGDSITAISGYPSELQTLLGDNFTVGNFGVTGSTVTLNSWKPYMSQPEFQKALDFKPDVVVILLGTNDDLKWARQYNEKFKDDYTKLITSFQQLENTPDIWIASSPPIFSNSSDLSPAYLIDTIIPKTQDLADTLNLPIIDLYSVFENHPEYFDDGIHPNSQGASIIAIEVYNSMDTVYDLNQTP